MAITSIGYDGTVNEAQWASMVPKVGVSHYGVVGAGDLKVTVHGSLDRGVSIATGSAWGQGVLDTSDSIGSLQAATVGSGSRYDLVVLRRNWSGAGGATTLALVQGTSTKGIPARNTSPGTLDDQPLALIRIDAGQTAVQEIVDLRCWGRNGGLVAMDDLAKDYLTDVGTRVSISGVNWVRRVGTGGSAEWVRANATVQAQSITIPISSGATSGSLAVTFPTPFSSAPVVTMTKGTTSGSASSQRRLIPVVTGITATGFSAYIETTDGSGVGAAFNVVCHYVAALPA